MLPRFTVVACVFSMISAPLLAEERPSDSAATRGREALLRSHELFLPKFRAGAYDDAWRAWGLTEKPAEYDRLFRERYGLHPADHGNDGLPMGLRYIIRNDEKSLTLDCLICHASSFNGRSLIGTPNASLDYTALVHELSAVDPKAFVPEKYETLNTTRGTSEVSRLVLGAFSVRDPDLSLRDPEDARRFRPAGIEEPPIIPEEPPAWWNLKRKRDRMYVTGMADARSRRSMMVFLLDPRADEERLSRLEPTFDDIRSYILSLEPPKYPFAIDRQLADRGRRVFERNCAECHGSHDRDADYPGRLVSLDEVGTDPARALSAYPAGYVEFYNRTWFGRSEESQWNGAETDTEAGYIAPPLHGIWATAPYLHNGSVPTLEHLLNSESRPTTFTRTYRTDSNDYDESRVGWRTIDVDPRADHDRSTLDGRRVYDTTRPGHSNQGHTFGDALTDDERREVIEYLKTL